MALQVWLYPIHIWAAVHNDIIIIGSYKHGGGWEGGYWGYWVWGANGGGGAIGARQTYVPKTIHYKIKILASSPYIILTLILPEHSKTLLLLLFCVV